MLRKVYLHGYLSKFHEGPVLITGNTAAEIVEGVTRQLKGFAPRPGLGRHRIKVVDFETPESLYQPLGDLEEIHLVPQLAGGKNGGLMQILLGVALVAAGFFTGGATWFGGMMIKVGALMLLGGLTQMLSPQPEPENQQHKTRYLGAPSNTTKIGTRIGILYGKDRVGGQYLSFDINARQSDGD